MQQMERLINIVKKNPLLYDQNDPNYARKDVKNIVWKRIARTLDYSSGDHVRETWRKLRDCHRDALRRQKRRYGLPSKKWAYQREMEFLLPYMFTKAVMTKSEEENFGQVDVDCDELTVKEEISDSCDISASEQKERIDDANPIDIEHCDENKIKEEIQLAFDEDANKSDALYQFFVSMYTSTKKLPKHLQLQIKRKLFEAVSVAEESVVDSNHTQTSATYYDIEGL